MYDRPDLSELLEAARLHFEEKILPVARQNNHQLYFQTLVAINVMKIAEREIEARPRHLRAEWARLRLLLDTDMPEIESDSELEAAIQDANRQLCERIRAGDFDADNALFEHLKARSIEQLEIANPKFLGLLEDEGEVQ